MTSTPTIRHTVDGGICACGVEHQPRERPVTCSGCNRQTWSLDGVCTACYLRRLISRYLGRFAELPIPRCPDCMQLHDPRPCAEGGYTCDCCRAIFSDQYTCEQACEALDAIATMQAARRGRIGP